MTPRVALAALLVAVVPAAAQERGRTDSAVVLPPIEVAVTRAPTPLARAPFAVSLTESPLTAADLGLSLAAALAGVPGIAAQARGNAARDDGMAIRGFGARAAFGVRGVRILLDGIPQTLPDGQSQLTLLNLRRIAEVEVLRGAASSLHGNATGGVVSLRTSRTIPARASADARVALGSDGLVTADLGGRTALGTGFLDAAVQRDAADGYRAQSRFEVVRTHLATRQQVRGVGSLGWVFDHATYPEAQDPGALTAAEVEADPRQANPAYVAVNAGKAVWQAQMGLTLERRLGPGGWLESAVFAVRRDLDNRLPFAAILLDRWAWGGRAVATVPLDHGARAALVTGADLQWLRDDRVHRTPDQAEITRDQLETVREIGPFAQLRLVPAGAVTVIAGVRYDWVTFGVTDRMLTNGDASGARTMQAPSATLGVSVAVGSHATTWARVGTAFETPTTTELANTPEGGNGFNPDLEPQHATELELGIRVSRGSVQAGLVGFRADVRDELIAFEVPTDPGRRYFRNAGRARHQGIEVDARWQAGIPWVGAAYTLSDLRFTDYATDDAVYDGNRIPGVAMHLGRLAAGLRTGPAAIETEVRAASDMFADDANTATADAWWVADLRLSAEFLTGAWRLVPAAGVENVFGQRYIGAVAVNGANGRYYEPAAGRTVYGGVTLRAW
jgi:iron complex outermembrane receptor protein